MSERRRRVVWGGCRGRSLPPRCSVCPIATRLALGVVTALALSSCAMVPYAGADQKARLVHSLYIKIAILAAIVFFGVLGTLILEITAFHKRKDDDTPAVQDHGKPAVYAGFFVIGFILVAILFPTSELTLGKVDQVAKHPGLHLKITGTQWQWAAQYVNKGFTVSGQTYKHPMRFELPINKTVKVDLTSNDVMHDFFLPQFLYDKNATPGITNTFSFTPDRLGTFPGQCAQLCGVGHYQMKFVLKVVKANQFQRWVKQQKAAVKTTNCPAPKSRVTLVAHNISWDKKCISVPPNQPFTVVMHNKDQGITHNFAIYKSPQRKHELYKGPLFPGIATKVLHVPPLKVGTYYFQCDVHGRAMSGTLVVGKQGSGEHEAEAEVHGTNITLVAHNISFEVKKITVPTGKPVTVTFVNKDSGITHNFAIYKSPDLNKNLFKGPLIKGPAKKTLHVPALPAGTYYFQCDVHGKAMSGTYEVEG